MEPTPKHPDMEKFLENTYGRTTAITTNKCVICGGDATEFRNPLSLKEYKISGMCQKCQDETFGHD